MVDRVAKKFLATDGDLRATVRAIIDSPEFWDPKQYRAKVKSPFEFIVSAIRVTGADATDARPIVRSLQQLGMPLYQCQPPTGYKDTTDAWVRSHIKAEIFTAEFGQQEGLKAQAENDPQVVKAIDLLGKAKDLAEIVSGVNEGDQVIVSGGYGLPEKTKVRVKQ